MLLILLYAFITDSVFTTVTKPAIEKSSSYEQDAFKLGDQLIQQLQQKHGDFLYDDDEQANTVYFTNGVNKKSIEITEEDLDELNNFEEDNYTSSLSIPKEQTVLTFRVHNDRLKKIKTSHKNQFSSIIKNTKLQHELWQRFTQLIPPDNREMIKRFKIMTDGSDNTLGYVQQMYDENYWELALDYADAQNLKDLYATLIHEYGHLFSLNSYEYIHTLNCRTDKILDVCYKKEAYIYDFYEKFWQDDTIADWPGSSASEKELITFYDEHFDEFVSDYATTDVTEDFAESWMYFILTEKPKRKLISDDKILFFYQYPELVELRNIILMNLSKQYK